VANAPRDSERQRAIASAAPAKTEARSGADAVQFSVQQNAMKENVSLDLAGEKKKDAKERILVSNSATNQFVGAKNFFNQSNVWVDADYRPGTWLPETNVKFASEEYFELLRRESSLARYFALGQQVVVVYNNRIYRVTE
jgi:hypothetical protein